MTFAIKGGGGLECQFVNVNFGPIINGLKSDIFTEPARMCIFLQKENKNNQEDYRKHVLGICKRERFVEIYL